MAKLNTSELQDVDFRSMEQASDYVKTFSTVDAVVDYADLHMCDSNLAVNGKELPMTKTALSQLLTNVTPGATRFLRNEDVPIDLVNDVVNRMFSELRGKRMIRVETDGDNKTYVKAFLSEKYRPYSNEEFIDYIGTRIDTEKEHVLRPAITNGAFSVNTVSKELTVATPENFREVKLGSNYTNGECGDRAIAIRPYTFDSFCENGCIFGRQFLGSAVSRVFHYGGNTSFTDRLNRIESGKDIAAKMSANYATMHNTAMNVLYYGVIAERICSISAAMPRKIFEKEIPFDATESNFDFYNRITDHAHNSMDIKGRVLLEEVGGYMVGTV